MAGAGGTAAVKGVTVALGGRTSRGGGRVSRICRPDDTACTTPLCLAGARESGGSGGADAADWRFAGVVPADFLGMCVGVTAAATDVIFTPALILAAPNPAIALANAK